MERLEAERIFCRHGLDHLLTVARLMRIYSLEEHKTCPGAAVCHRTAIISVGGPIQFRGPHEEAGWRGPILADCGFSPGAGGILMAIGGHRNSATAQPEWGLLGGQTEQALFCSSRVRSV